MSSPYPKVWLDEQGIVNIEFAKHAHITRPMIKQAHKAFNKLKPRNVLLHIDASNVSGYDHDAAQYLKNYAFEKTTVACAILVQSMLSKHLIEQFIFYHKPSIPMKIFEDKKEGINWLKTFL